MPRALREHYEPWRAERPRAAGWAIAACVAARTDLLRRLGPFDPSAFLFYEDLDLCLRARAAGVPTVLQDGVTLVHAGGHSTGPEDVARQVARRRAVIRANLGRRALALDDTAQLLEHGVRPLRARDRAFVREIRRARG
jgi:GT2 family glycosyltransferase